MKTMKKVLALVLAVALTIGCVVVFANAEGLTTYKDSVLTYTLSAKEGDTDSDLYVNPGDSFTVTINMQTNYYAGVEGKEALFYTSGVVNAVTKDDITLGTVASSYVTPSITANLATGGMPAGYKTGYKAVVVGRLGTYNPDDPEEIVPPVVYTEPTDVYSVTFTVPATAQLGSTIQFEMPAASVASASVTGRSALIFQKVINNDTSALNANDVASNYAETVNLPDPLVITVGAPPVLVDKTALAEAIATLPAIGQDEATSASWTAYTDALAAAQAVYNDDDATQDEVDTAALALTNATNGVTKLGNCDYTALDAAITAYEALTLDDYTPASVTASDVTAKYDAAKAVTRDMLDDEAGVNQGAINTAAQELNAAIAALVLRADKTALEAAIIAAQAKVETDYMPNSWTEADLTAALANAQAVYNDANATTEEVAAQVTALTEAMGKLVAKADKAALEAAIATLPTVDQAEATSASWAAYEAALAAANEVDADANATQAAVDAAKDALIEATAAVEKLAECDYTALSAAIEAYDALDLNAYTPNSVADSDVAAKADAAKAVPAGLLNDEAGENQGAINAAVAALNEAIEALVEKADKTELIAAIANAQGKAETDYTPTSWDDADLETVVADAQLVVVDDNATVDEVAAQVAAINEAIDKLVARADKEALIAAIAAASALKEEDYTPASWTDAELAAVIEAGQAVVDDNDATAQDVAAAIEDLNTAVQTLVAKANKEALATAIATLPTVAQAEATSASWSAYETALAAAQEVYDDANANQNDVDTATNNLLAAIDGVTPLGTCDYTELNNQIAAYEALNFEDYTPNSVTASDVTAKYAATGEVEADLIADEAGENQAIIDAAANELKAAIEALVLKGDKTELIAEIAAAPAMDEDTATEDSWNAYQDELVEAQAVVDDENADQAAVDAAKAELVAAKELVSRELCDYTALDAALALVPEKDESEYTAETWNAYAAAKAEAEQVDKNLVNNKAGTNQQLIDDAAAKLTTAYNHLRGNGCSITSFTCTQEHYMRDDVVTFAFVTKGQGYAKIQVLRENGATLTYDRKNGAVDHIDKNDDGTETWYINIKIYNNGEFVYQARAKVFNAEGGWDTDYIDFNGKTSTGDDATVKSAGAFVNDVEVTAATTNDTIVLRAVVGKDTRRVRFVNPANNTTLTLSTPKSVNEDGTKVFEINRKLQPVDYTYLIDTADSTNKWTRSDATVSVSVTKYVAPTVLPTTGDINDAVISVDASPRVLRFSPQTFTVVTDANASGFRLVDAKTGSVVATQKADGVTEGNQTTWTLVKYYSTTGTFTYKVQAKFGTAWVDSGKTVTFTVAY